MNFYRLNSAEPVAQIVADIISTKLSAGQKVFWVVTGGSNINMEVKVGRLLKNRDLSNLSVTLTDERFGEVGHIDSNWQQLLDSGFEIHNATLFPILKGYNRRKTTTAFSTKLAELLDECDYSIGIFGIGPDGHTAGILPGSPGIMANELAVGYSDEDIDAESLEGVKRGFSRITMTAKAIAKLDHAIVCAFGEAKHNWLDKLEESLTIEQNPAQALKKAGKLSIYSDVKGIAIK